MNLKPEDLEKLKQEYFNVTQLDGLITVKAKIPVEAYLALEAKRMGAIKELKMRITRTQFLSFIICGLLVEDVTVFGAFKDGLGYKTK